MFDMAVNDINFQDMTFKELLSFAGSPGGASLISNIVAYAEHMQLYGPGSFELLTKQEARQSIRN